MSDDRNLETLPNDDAVEVVLLWGGAAQKADLYRGEFQVKVGADDEADFVVPSAAFTLVEPQGDQLAIELPESATGAFATPIGSVDVALWAVGADGLRRGTVPRMSQGLVHVGTVDFLVRGVAAPEPLAAAPLAPQLRDVRWGGVSILAHAAAIAGMLLVPPSAMSLSLDNDQLRARMIQASMAPSEMVEEPAPEWLEHQQAQGGMDGQPSQGDEGAAGNPESHQKNKRMTIKGRPDNDEPRIPDVGREERARTAGILGILQAGSSPMGHMYGDPGAEGRDLATLWGNVTGAEPGEAFGAFGLGMQGTGRGGCPIGQVCTARGTVGVGNSNLIGTIGGCSRERLAQLIRDHGRAQALDMCTGGQGGPGTGPGLRDGGRHEKVPPRITGTGIAKGPLSREQIRRTVHLHMNEVRYCYEQALQSNPDLDGRVVVRFVINGRGGVMTSVTESSTLGAAPASCVSNAVKRWQFAAAEDGGVTSVNYPFTFTHPE